MTSETIAKARDKLEDAIIMALHMDKTRAAPRKAVRRADSAGFKVEEMGMEEFCPKEPAYPKRAYTFDARSSDRLYAADMSGLVVDPITAIGHRLEVMLFAEDETLKWSCFKPMPRPKRLVALTNQPHQWYCLHHRTFSRGGPQTYSKRPFAITTSGQVCLIKPMGGWNFYPQQDQQEIEGVVAMSLSLMEDAHRSSSFLAVVEEHVQLMFPIGAEAYKAFLIMRDGYRATSSGRKNPILHWCAEHMRQRNGKVSVIEEHLRGAEEFVVGPMRLTISASGGYGPFMGPRDD